MNAQTAMNKYALDVNLIKNEYSGDMGNGIFNFSDNRFGGGLTLQRWMNPSFNLGAELSYGDYGFKKNPADQFKGMKLDLNVFGSYKFNNGYLLPVDNKLSPFVTLGFGLANYSEKPSIKATGVDPFKYPMIITGTELIIPVGAGLSFKISEKLSIQYKYIYNITTSDIHDQNRGADDPIYNGELKNVNDAFGKHVISLRIGLGNNKDDDKDGVYDKKDLCLGTPENVTVDEKGCPVDGDLDGVADYLDKCDKTPAGVKVDENGCPVDSDKDGVADYLDKSPNTPANVKVDAEGRPLDTDKDGIADYKDKCPGTPAKIRVDANGCPVDTDKDGVADDADKCSDTPSGVKVDAAGCPVDTDKDGVADYMDKCPNEKGTVVNKGCPDAKAEQKAEPKPEPKVEPKPEVKVEPVPEVKPVVNVEAKIAEINILDIPFETGKSAIGKSNFAKLDNVVAIMQEFKDIKVEVGGHADSQGSASANMKLSESRAEMVKAYLIHKGIDEARLTTKGYGITVPVADNATAEGRAQNRRASFKVVK
jgi:outer membrane protein OmpA-like peptidoglycan-associated protein/opacity protein-like surface antigen